MTDHVTVCEMSPRDGVQFLGGADREHPTIVPIDRKAELIQQLIEAGLPYIEVGSFVSRKHVPQMADTGELTRHLLRIGRVRLAALVPNVEYLRRFEETDLDTVALFVSASETHSQRNVFCSVDEALVKAREVALEVAKNKRLRLRAHLSAAFREIYDGPLSDVTTVQRLVRELLGMGCEYVTLADTNGDANPREVRDRIKEIVDDGSPVNRLGVHLHDHNGYGLANAYAAFEAGIRIFDASVGGLGGSVKAAKVVAGRGAQIAGNIATEALVHMFHSMGIHTGIDLDRLFHAGATIYQMTQFTGDYAPPSPLLRERLGYGSGWVPAPAAPRPDIKTRKAS